MRDLVKYCVVGYIISKCAGLFLSLFVLVVLSSVAGTNMISWVNVFALWIIGKIFFRRKRRGI